MKTVPPRITVPLVMGLVLLLMLVFPSSLDASVSLHSTASPSLVHQNMLPLALGHHVPPPKRVQDSGLLIDADARLRAATALSSNPAIERVAAHSRVPLRMIVITANTLLDA
jgi:hypothetical protein